MRTGESANLRPRRPATAAGMAHASTFALVLATSLLLCGAELSGTWYSANVINDADYTPKPNSGIFSTQPPFSSTHPIVVLSPSSTPAPPANSFSTGGTPEHLMSTYSTTQSAFPQSSYVPPLPTSLQTIDPNAVPESKPEFDLRPPFPFLFPQDEQQPPPNYFVVYQQPPQSLQNLPPSSQPAFSGPQSTLSTPPPTWSTPLSTWSTPPSTWTTTPSTWSIQPDLSSPSTFTTQRPELSTPQTTFSTFQSELSTTSPTFSTSSSQATLMSFRPTSDPKIVEISPSNSPSSVVTKAPSSSTLIPRPTRTARPCVNGTTSNILQKFPTLRIRMVAPSGSITNVNINPSTTTKKPRQRRSTTTRKPTTTRTRKNRNNRNTYNKCVDACGGGGRRPICASPLAQIPIDGNTLKGFPSVCHMACHNSFKKDQFEMVTEGRCGKLRTRIRTVDSEKLKRPELNKAQYTLVSSDNQQTLIEVSAITSRKGQ